VRSIKRFPSTEIAPPRADVLRRMEMPAGAPVSPALEGLMNAALLRFMDVADPLGVAEPISHGEFATVYYGDGRNAPDTPLELIATRAERLALFVVTVGQRLSDEIGRAFVSGDPALGLVLDAFASEGVNRLTYRLGADLLDTARRRGRLSAEAVVLPYSPGYCGWHVSGQRTLFEVVNAAMIGVSLGGSCLMSPMKSVSGVFVAGPPQVHRFRPDYAFCDECATRECLARMASVKRRT
jgi:hypothetical protein